MIDWIRAAELRDEVGIDDFAEVIDIFLEEVDGAINDLDQITNRTDLESQLHFLKGSALNIGFHAFADLCQQGETQSAQGQADNVDLAAISAAYHSARTQFLEQSSERLGLNQQVHLRGVG